MSNRHVISYGLWGRRLNIFYVCVCDVRVRKCQARRKDYCTDRLKLGLKTIFRRDFPHALASVQVSAPIPPQPNDVRYGKKSKYS